MNKILNHLQTGLLMILMIQYASHDKPKAIQFLVLLIGISIVKTLISEYKKTHDAF